MRADKSIPRMEVVTPVNNVQRFREAQLMAKSTIDRIEAGKECRMETKRKILFALGLTVQDSTKIFPRLKNGSRRAR